MNHSLSGYLSLVIFMSAGSVTRAHDTWVEANTNLIRTGDAVEVDLKLGNHGNEHRDFKLASKIRLDGCTLDVTTPEGRTYDLKPNLVDVGYAPTDGYWSARLTAATPGLYLVSHVQDAVVNHGRPVRSIKSAKTCFVASARLDDVSLENPGFDRVRGHALELVCVGNPVTPMGPGMPLSVRLLWHGRPMSAARVSFIPRTQPLTAEFDPQYERLTDEKGEASFTPTSGDRYLIVAHHRDENERGEGYELTQYAATLSVLVPQLCPCCE